MLGKHFTRKQPKIRLKFPQRQKINRCHREELLWIWTYYLCRITAAETNSLVNFAQMVIKVACNSSHHHKNTIKSTTLHLRPKTYKVLDFRRSFLQYWMFVCPNRNSNPAVKINTVSADFQRNCLRCFQ